MKLQLSVMSIVGGLLGALGVLGLLQQSGSVYPTSMVTLAALVAGLAWGILLPSIVRTRRVRRAAARRARHA